MVRTKLSNERTFVIRWTALVLILLYGKLPRNFYKLRSVPIIILGNSIAVAVTTASEISMEEEDEFVKELMEEERQKDEELMKFQSEMRELDDLKTQQHQKQAGRSKNNSKMSPGANNDRYSSIEDEIRKKEVLLEEDKVRSQKKAKDAAEKEQRERKNKMELENLVDKNAKKKLKQQMVKDAKITKRILADGKKLKHYAVLGMWCKWGEIKIGPLRLCNISTAKIKHAKRNVARLIHPDKNRDKNAAEAFDTLETSASILLDDEKRNEYEIILKKRRNEIIDHWFVIVRTTLKRFLSFLSLIKTLCGPFSTPIIILFALAI